MPEKYDSMDPLTAMGFLVNAMGGGGDSGQSFPRSDAEDMSAGARFIPGEVTLARRAGQRVEFVRRCPSPLCWYWLMPNGDRIYHYAPGGSTGDRCEHCGNTNLSGGTIKTEDAGNA